MKTPAHPTARTRDSVAMVVPIGRLADVSPDLPLIIRVFLETIDFTTSTTNSIEIRFPMTSNVGAFRPTYGCDVHGGASFDARDREPLGGISSVENLHYERVVVSVDVHPNSKGKQQQTTLLRRHPERKVRSFKDTRQGTRRLTRTSF